MCRPFRPLGTGLAAMGHLSSEFGACQGQVRLAEGLAAQLVPALVQQRQGQFSPFGAAGGVQYERCSTCPGWVMRSDVVGHTMVFPQTTEQQARHA